MRYWDSSAIIPLIIEEKRSNSIRALLKEDNAIITWWATPVECYSALCRLKRDGLKDADFQILKNSLHELVYDIDMLTPSLHLRNRSMRLLGLHPLRAGDALQLASALTWLQDQNGHAEFVCLDDRLRRAASLEGFTLLPDTDI